MYGIYLITKKRLSKWENKNAVTKKLKMSKCDLHHEILARVIIAELSKRDI